MYYYKWNLKNVYLFIYIIFSLTQNILQDQYIGDKLNDVSAICIFNFLDCLVFCSHLFLYL